MYSIFYSVLLLFLSATSVLASARIEDDWISEPWDNLFVVVNQGNGEASSIGSYSLRVYRNNRDAFIDGRVDTRNGSIAGLWFADLDSDHNPEVCIWLENTGSGSYGELRVYTLEDAQLKQIQLSEPSFRLTSGYRGHDEYTLQDGQIYRTFPLYRATDSMSEPTGGTTRLILDFASRRWVETGELSLQ